MVIHPLISSTNPSPSIRSTYKPSDPIVLRFIHLLLLPAAPEVPPVWPPRFAAPVIFYAKNPRSIPRRTEEAVELPNQAMR